MIELSSKHFNKTASGIAASLRSLYRSVDASLPTASKVVRNRVDSYLQGKTGVTSGDIRQNGRRRIQT